MSRLYVVLLAGGVGSRLAPLSTPDHPKQFMTLPGQTESLLQQAAHTALELVPASQVITVSFARLHNKVKAQLKAIDPGLCEHLLIEPDGAGTAAASSIAALYATERTQNAALWLMPCDHDRQPPMQLGELRPKVENLLEDHIVTFGAKPYAADEGFGYLLAEGGGGRVKRFIEKPDATVARTLLETREAWWNSGMFAFSAPLLLRRMQVLHPEVLALCKEALHMAKGGILGGCYREIRCESIDRAIMERSDNLVLLPLPGGWADIGTWPRLLRWWQNHSPHVQEWHFAGRQAIRLEDAVQYASSQDLPEPDRVF